MKNKFGILAVLLLTSLVFSGPYDTWSNFRAVTVNTTTAAVTGTVTNFPLLVRLTNVSAATGSDVLAASPTGADVRFTDATGATALSYQIEQWSATSAAIWVLVPSIAGSSTTDIRMYWGMSGQTSLSSGPAVFDTANGFAAVFHMNKGDTTSEQDATINAFTALEFAQPPDTVGIIGRTRSLNGTSQHFLVNNTVSGVMDFRPTSNYSLSTWYYQTTTTTAQKVMIDKGDNDWSLAVASNFYYEFQGARGTRCSGGPTNSSGYCVANTNAPTANGGTSILASNLQNTWHHIAGTFTGGTTAVVESLFIDGALVAVAPSSAYGTTSADYTFNVSIGALVAASSAYSRFWNGMLDEMEVSKVVRSASWVKLSYATQTAAQTAVTLGATQTTAPPVTVPGAPTGVAGVAGNAQVAVSWTAPGSTGGAAITSYTATSNPGGFTCSGSTTGCTVTGLTNGVGYTFTVTATNSAGAGPASVPSGLVTPFVVSGVPGAPVSPTATAGNAQATVSWTAGTAGTSATITYTVTSNPDGKTCAAAAPTTTCNVTTLTNGTPYTFTVVATNLQGASAPSAATSPAVTPVGVPTAPAAPTGVVGNAQVAVSWAAPSNGGSAITSYTVSRTPVGTGCTATAPAVTCTVTGLTNGTSYTFTVTATNAIGAGAASPASASLTPVGPPAAPAAPTATGLGVVSWNAPADNGGSAITSYTVVSVPAGGTCTATAPATTCTVTTGLTSGSIYNFTVTATNAIGTSAVSPVSNGVVGILSFTAQHGFGIHRTGSSVSFQLPSASGAEVSVMDIWGRTVWSQSVGAGVGQTVWNGMTSTGRVAHAGLYMVHMKLHGANARTSVVDTKMIYTP